MSQQWMTRIGQIIGTVAIAFSGICAIINKANAALLFSDTDSFSDQRTELIGMPELTVSKYTPLPGVNIDEVQIIVTGTIKASGNFKNNNRQTIAISASNIINQYDFVPETESPPLSTVSIFPSLTTIGEQSYILASGETADFGPFSMDRSNNQSFTGADISNFLGSGEITYEPFTQVFTPISGQLSNLAFSFTTVADGSLTIKYFGSRTSTSEPSVLLGLGILSGLGLITKKRINK